MTYKIGLMITLLVSVTAYGRAPVCDGYEAKLFEVESGLYCSESEETLMNELRSSAEGSFQIQHVKNPAPGSACGNDELVTAIWKPFYAKIISKGPNKACAILFKRNILSGPSAKVVPNFVFFAGQPSDIEGAIEITNKQ